MENGRRERAGEKRCFSTRHSPEPPTLDAILRLHTTPSRGPSECAVAWQNALEHSTDWSWQSFATSCEHSRCNSDMRFVFFTCALCGLLFPSRLGVRPNRMVKGVAAACVHERTIIVAQSATDTRQTRHPRHAGRIRLTVTDIYCG